MLSPRLTYVHVTPFTGVDDPDALYFPPPYPEAAEGRVTFEGRTTSQMGGPEAAGAASRDGHASPEDFLVSWEEHLAAVAARRRAMGKPMA